MNYSSRVAEHACFVYKSSSPVAAPHHPVPEIGGAAGFSPWSPTVLGLTSSILLAQSLCVPLTPGVVGLSWCLQRDRSTGKHSVKKRRCLMEQADSSAEKDEGRRQLKGKEPAWETCVLCSGPFLKKMFMDRGFSTL